MEEISRFFQAIVSDNVTLAFSIATAAVFAWALIAVRLASPERAALIERAAPTLMTTLGVLGTFAGIFIGLLDFDVQKIDESVPALLTGLKIAFATSIVGMSASILFKVIETTFPIKAYERSASAERILQVLTEIRDENRQSTKDSSGQLTTIRSSISGEGESSLVTQIQKLRTNFSDDSRNLRDVVATKFDEQISEFRKFSETMAENNSKALIQALEQVIRDFNTKLTEQFGENFKQLNSAVAALLTWQDNYKAHVEKLEDSFRRTVDAIDRTDKSLQSVAESTAAIPKQVESLGTLLAAIKTQTDDLSAHLSAVANLKDRAISAFPVIERNIEVLTQNFSSSVNESISAIQQTLKGHGSSHDELQRGFQTLADKIKATATTFEEQANQILTASNLNLQKTIENATSTMEKHFKSQNDRAIELIKKSASDSAELVESISRDSRQRIKESFEALSNVSQANQTQLREATESMTKILNDSFEGFDRQMQQEVSRTIETMGRGLASISEKLTSDYRPLVDKLREVMTAATRV